MKEIILKFLPPRISIPLMLHIVLLIGMLRIENLNEKASHFLQVLFANLPTAVIAVTAILLYLVLLTSYIVLCFKTWKNLKPKLGVLWDKDKEPYCPFHRTPLARHKMRINGKTETALNCPKCNKTLPLIDDNANRLSLTEARKLL